MVLDRARRRALLFGGVSGDVFQRDVWADLDSLQWTVPSLAPQPYGLSENAIIEVPTEDALYAIGAHRAFSVARCDLSTLTWRDLQAVGGPPTAVSYRTTAIHDAERNSIVVFDGGEAIPEPWAVGLHAKGTLTVDHLETRVDTLAGQATIWWRTRDYAVPNATLERRMDQGHWENMGFLPAFEGGLFTHIELHLSPGSLYEFRLRCQDGSGWAYTGVTSFVAPDRPAVEIFRVFPNPAPGELSVRYSLPGPASSRDRIEIFDLSGRKVLEHELTDGGNLPGCCDLARRLSAQGCTSSGFRAVQES